jgi:Rrf2 family protein
MANVWKMSDAVSLAVHTMVFLAQQPDQRATTRQIADRYGFSQHHLAKIHQRLTRDGLLSACRGPGGGVELTAPPRSVTLLRIYESIEGPAKCEACLLHKPVCGRTNCIFGNLVRDVNERIKAYFAETTLADLVESK